MEPRTWTVEDHLAGQPADSVALYQRFVAMLAECGPVSYSVTKTTITFKGGGGVRRARPTRRGLSVYLDLQRVIEDRRVISAAPYTRRLFVHQIRLTAPQDLDEEFRRPGRGDGVAGGGPGAAGAVWFPRSELPERLAAMLPDTRYGWNVAGDQAWMAVEESP